jgi:ATP-dependent DNA ligase
MLLVRTEKLPEGANWLYELKLDGYRCIAFKSGGKIHNRTERILNRISSVQPFAGLC